MKKCKITEERNLVPTLPPPPSPHPVSMVQEGTNLSKKWIYGGWVRGGPSEGSGNDNPFLEIRKNSWFLFNGGGGGGERSWKTWDMTRTGFCYFCWWLTGSPENLTLYKFYSTAGQMSPSSFSFPLRNSLNISPMWKKHDVLDPSLTWALRASVRRLLASVSQDISFRQGP